VMDGWGRLKKRRERLVFGLGRTVGVTEFGRRFLLFDTKEDRKAAEVMKSWDTDLQVVGVRDHFELAGFAGSFKQALDVGMTIESRSEQVELCGQEPWNQKTVSQLYVPEMFLDDHGRVVGGTVIEERRAFSEADTKLQVAVGRFSIHLDDVRNCGLSFLSKTGERSVTQFEITAEGIRITDRATTCCQEGAGSLRSQTNTQRGTEKSIERGKLFLELSGEVCECPDDRNAQGWDARGIVRTHSDWGSFVTFFQDLPRTSIQVRTKTLDGYGGVRYRTSNIFCFNSRGPVDDRKRIRSLYLRRPRIQRCIAPARRYPSTLTDTLRNLPILEPKQPVPSKKKQQKQRHWCELCGRNFDRASRLVCHIAINHKREVLFPCSLCARSSTPNPT